jgi:hypothetical protein
MIKVRRMKIKMIQKKKNEYNDKNYKKMKEVQIREWEREKFITKSIIKKEDSKKHNES